jgi:hypothetical protein
VIGRILELLVDTAAELVAARRRKREEQEHAMRALEEAQAELRRRTTNLERWLKEKGL